MPEALSTCPICWAKFTPTGRQIYCTDRCRKTAYQRRQRHTCGTSTVARAAATPAPVDERACPHCANPITVITLITTPQAARPRLRPLSDTQHAPTVATVTTMPEQQIRRERLDMPDAIELAETLAFLRHWTSGRDHELLAESLQRFIGVDGDHLADLHSDLARFAFLLADITDEVDDQQQPTEPEINYITPEGVSDPVNNNTRYRQHCLGKMI